MEKIAGNSLGILRSISTDWGSEIFLLLFVCKFFRYSFCVPTYIQESSINVGGKDELHYLVKVREFLAGCERGPCMLSAFATFDWLVPWGVEEHVQYIPLIYRAHASDGRVATQSAL